MKKVFQILKYPIKIGTNKHNGDYLTYKKEDINEVIEQLEVYIANNQGIKRRLDNALNSLNTLKNNSCNDCIHLDKKEKNLKFECLIDICRSCKRSNIDRWDSK